MPDVNLESVASYTKMLVLIADYLSRPQQSR
jgi:hypothetical protein